MQGTKTTRRKKKRVNLAVKGETEKERMKERKKETGGKEEESRGERNSVNEIACTSNIWGPFRIPQDPLQKSSCDDLLLGWSSAFLSSFLIRKIALGN